MGKLYKGIRLYLHYVSIQVRSMMQYKTSLILSIIGQFIGSFQVFLGIFVMFQRFSRVEGFTYSQVLLCYGIVLMEFSLAEMFARGFDMFSGLVRSGEFDRILVRPQNEILQVLGSRFELTRLGRMIQAVVMFFYGIWASGITWNFAKVLTIIFMLIGGIAVFSGLFLIYAALCFFTMDGLEFMNVFTDGAREFGKYPMAVYGKKALLFATVIIPYAWIQYYPLLYLLGRETSFLFMLMPLGACWFLVPAWLLWRYGVRNYQSSGS